ncbi:MAG: hypothetical protein IH944_05955 [Armatimonadetes bacterium]|nr:hypothetical protein [Armatimonadota bacterium]
MQPTEISKHAESAVAFEEAAHRIFAKYEGSPSRIITLHASKNALGALSIAQENLFAQALGCTQHSYYRAAHVLAWAAFMDFLQEKLDSDGLLALHVARPAYAKYATLDDLRDWVRDHDFITISKELSLITKSKMKTLHGLLSQRNECAHPGTVEPTMNETLGYISKLLGYIKEIQPKTL